MKKQELRERIAELESVLRDSVGTGHKLRAEVRDLRAKLAKAKDCYRALEAQWKLWVHDLEAERDALKAELADMERDRDIWRADANALRDRWMAAVKVNNALKEERTKLKGDNGDPFTFWKSIVKKDIDTDA